MNAHNEDTTAFTALDIMGRITEIMRQVLYKKMATELVQAKFDTIKHLLLMFYAIGRLKKVGPHGELPVEVAYRDGSNRLIRERVWLGAIRVLDIYEANTSKREQLEQFNPEHTRFMLLLAGMSLANEHQWTALAEMDGDWSRQIILAEHGVWLPVRKEANPARKYLEYGDAQLANAIEYFDDILVVLKSESF